MALPNYCSKDFRHYVEVQSVTETADGFGGFTTSWANRGYIWCLMEETGGGEGLAADRLETSTSVVFTTRYRSDILVTDRLVVYGIEYNIRRVDNIDRRNKYLKIHTDSGVPN